MLIPTVIDPDTKAKLSTGQAKLTNKLISYTK
jgi:hypothetical protein